MTKLTDYYNIQVTQSTSAVTRKDFKTLAFISEHAVFSERYRLYSSVDSLLEDGFTEDSVEYKAATRAFGQKNVPSYVVFGRKQVPSVNGAITTLTNNYTYTLTVSGTEYTFTSDANATAIEVVAGLKAAYDLNPKTSITFTDNLDGTFDVASSVDWSITSGNGITLTNGTSTESWVDAINALKRANKDWFGLTVSTRDGGEQLAIAEYMESDTRFFYAATNDAVAPTSGTTDIGSVLAGIDANHTAVFFHTKADEQYPDVALMAYQLQEEPGTSDWAPKELFGVTPDVFTDTESNYLKGKNYTTFEEINGISTTHGCKTAGGEWVDRIIGVMEYVARLQEDFWSTTVNSKKVPYTNEGASVFRAIIMSENQRGIAKSFIAPTPAPVIYMPDVLSIDSNTRMQRRYEGIKISWRLAGAIRFVGVSLTVTA